MARKKGFVANKKGIGRILLEDGGIAAALDAVAEPAAATAGGHVEHYKTDRQVALIVVNAEDQAKDGVATKALGRQGLTLS